MIDSSEAAWNPPSVETIQIRSVPAGTGVAEKRNLALAAATGDVICWFDDDDWQHPSRVSMVVEALDRGALVAGGLNSWFVQLWTGQAAAHRSRSTVLFNGAGFRAELARAAIFDAQLVRASDTPWLRAVLARAGRAVTTLSQPLHLWLSHDTNLSNPSSRRRFDLPPEALRERLGPEVWQDTDDALEQLRDRLRARPPAPAPRPAATLAREPAGVVSAIDRPRPVALRRLLERLGPELPELRLGPRFVPGASLYLALSPSEVQLSTAARTVVVVAETVLDAALRRALARAAAVVALTPVLAAWLVRKGLKAPDLVLSVPLDPQLRPREALEPTLTLGLVGADQGAAAPGVQDLLGRSLAGRPLFGLDSVLQGLGRAAELRPRLLLDPGFAVDGVTARRAAAMGLEVERAPVMDGPHFYHRLDALIVGTEHEAGPPEALDAQLAGVPALCRAPAPLEALERMRWEAPDQLAERITTLAADRELARSGDEARREEALAYAATFDPRPLAALIRARLSPRPRAEPVAAPTPQVPPLLARHAAPPPAAQRNIQISINTTSSIVTLRPVPGSSAGQERVISVLMTAFATAPWIRDAAASILEQELPEGWSLELLIGVDDCVDTLAAARSIQDRRVTVYDLGVNGGTYRALNTLLSFARGQVIAIQDSDDLAEPGRLARCLNRLEEPDAPGVVSGQFIAVNEDLKPLGPPSDVPEDPRERYELAERCFLVPHGAAALRREVFLALGGYDDTRVSGDADLFVRAIASGWRVVVLPDVLLRYRQRHGPQLTRATETRRGSPMRVAYEADLRERWARYRQGERPAPVACPARSPVRGVHHGGAPRVAVVMPTVPSRQEGARAVIQALLPQGVARFVVLLNGHEHSQGLPEDPRIVYQLNPAGTGPAARLDVPLSDIDVVLFVDDDLLFPADYVSHTLRQLDQLGPGVALSYHASRWPPGSTAYLKRQTVTYADGAPHARSATWLGMGVSAIPSTLLPLVRGPRPAIFEINDDLWFSARLQAAGVRLLRPPSPARWIRATPSATAPEALYRQAQADHFRVREEAMMYAMAKLGWRPELPEPGEAPTLPAPAAGARRR